MMSAPSLTPSLTPLVAVNVLGLDKTSLYFQHFVQAPNPFHITAVVAPSSPQENKKKEIDCLNRLDRKFIVVVLRLRYLVGLGFGLGS
jgi:hypothetical protein